MPEDRDRDAGIISYTTRDAESIRKDLIERIPVLTDDWTDFHASDLGITLLELMSYLGDVLAYSQDRHAQETYLIDATERKNVRAQLRAKGYRMHGYMSSRLKVRFRTEHENDIRIPKYLQLSTETDEGESVYFATIEDMNFLQSETYVDVECLQGEVEEEEFGYGDIDEQGRIELAHNNIGENTINLVIDGQEWEKVDDAMLHPYPGEFYSIEYDTDDNVYIALYPGWTNLVSDYREVDIEIEYLLSAGLDGRIGSDKIINVEDDLYDADGEEISGTMILENFEESSGGQDREDIEHAKKHGIELAKTMWTAVTLEDYEVLSREVQGVSNSLALDWSFDDEEGTPSEKDISPDEPYQVDLYLVPDEGGTVTEILEETVLEYLKPRKVLTTEVNIKDTTYFTIDIEMEVHLTDPDDPVSAEHAIEEALEEYFDYKEREYSGVIRYVDLIREIEQAHREVIRADLIAPSSNVDVPFSQFPLLGDITITVL